jgi:hypothetical protein
VGEDQTHEPACERGGQKIGKEFPTDPAEKPERSWHEKFPSSHPVEIQQLFRAERGLNYGSASRNPVGDAEVLRTPKAKGPGFLPGLRISSSRSVWT